MTTHRFHPDPARGDPPEAILWDDCPRCAQHAKDPRGLDREHLLAIVKVCRDGAYDHQPTVAERTAEHVVYQALCLVERLTDLPWRTLVDAGLAVPT
jgi:hypothetical protein